MTKNEKAQLLSEARELEARGKPNDLKLAKLLRERANAKQTTPAIPWKAIIR